MRATSFLPFAALLAAAAVALAAEPAPQKANEAGALEAKCEKEGDAVKVTVEGGKAILSVTSKSGIGRATVERKAERWPDELILRLHLRGLEALNIAAGDLRLSTSLPSYTGGTRLYRVSKEGDEGLKVDKDSPYWMDIQVFGLDGKPIKGLPRDGGWFEMRLPKGLLGDQVKVVTLRWIDFYRQ
ncbi:MAG: hypothetical protein FJ290_21870 [Planctomycetes bacterium]|nr:hypothetical protein [Planctomycetota bacterium]